MPSTDGILLPTVAPEDNSDQIYAPGFLRSGKLRYAISMKLMRQTEFLGTGGLFA